LFPKEIAAKLGVIDSGCIIMKWLEEENHDYIKNFTNDGP